jgi:hypothetical protein
MVLKSYARSGFLAAAALLALTQISGCTPANAQTPTYAVSLTLPSQNTDGSALPLSQITSYTVAYKVGAAVTYTTKVVTGPFTNAAQSTTIPKAFGTTCANAFVIANGQTSAATAPDVCATNTAPPSPPSGLTVN